MRIPALAIVLVLVLATLAHAGPKGKKYKEHTIHGFKYDKHAVERLLDDSEVPGEVTAYDDGVREVKGKFRLDKSMKVEDAAIDFIGRHRNAFKLKEPKKELKLQSTFTQPIGSMDVRYSQVYNGLPIWGKSIRVHISKDRDLDLIDTNSVPTPDIDTTPLITPEEAVEIVKKGIEDIGEVVDDFDSSYETGLTIYIAANRPVLSYTVRIATILPTGSWLFFVDARKGRIITRETLAFSDGPLSSL